MHRAGFKKRKVIRHFCEMTTHFGKVVRYCKLLFAMYLHTANHYLQRICVFASYT